MRKWAGIKQPSCAQQCLTAASVHHLYCIPACPLCSGLVCPLQRLQLQLSQPLPGLMRTLSHHVQLTALALHVATPAAALWLPQLQRCTVRVQQDAQMELLTRNVEVESAQQLSGLLRLEVLDERPLFAREARPPALLVLPQLPSLRDMVRASGEHVCRWGCCYLQ